MLNALVGESIATCKIYVSNPIAGFHKGDHRVVCKIDAMAKVDVVQVLSQTAYGRDSSISNVPALGQHEVPQFRSSGNDPANGIVSHILATGKIQYAQILKV